jgi:pyruvate,water dikinase
MVSTYDTEFIVPLYRTGTGGAGTIDGRNMPLVGFATTEAAYHAFMVENDLDGKIRDLLDLLDFGRCNLCVVGAEIRLAIVRGKMPNFVAQAICEAYCGFLDQSERAEPPVAVWLAGAANDRPDRRWQESLCFAQGCEAVVEKVRDCFAWLFSDLAIASRVGAGRDGHGLPLPVGVQPLVDIESKATQVAPINGTEAANRDMMVISGGTYQQMPIALHGD